VKDTGLRNGFDVQTTDDVEWMLDYLSTKFKCTQPSLELNAIATEYEYATETIFLNVGTWNSPNLTDAILHEFAHHLTREPGHEFVFTRNLVRVVKAWRGYARRNEYTWSMECASVQRWLPRFNQRKTLSKAGAKERS
jgi:hypothetical protein